MFQSLQNTRYHHNLTYIFFDRFEVNTKQIKTTLLYRTEYMTGNIQIALVAPDWYQHMTGNDQPLKQEVNGQVTVIPSQTQECLLIYHTRTDQNSVMLYKYLDRHNQMSVYETISVFTPFQLPSPNLNNRPNIHTAPFNCPYIPVVYPFSLNHLTCG